MYTLLESLGKTGELAKPKIVALTIVKVYLSIRDKINV